MEQLFVVAKTIQSPRKNDNHFFIQIVNTLRAGVRCIRT